MPVFATFGIFSWARHFVDVIITDQVFFMRIYGKFTIMVLSFSFCIVFSVEEQID